MWNTNGVARTGQPSGERVAASQRALAILDLLAESGPARDERDRAPARARRRAPSPATSERSSRRGSSSTTPRTAATGSGSTSSTSANAVLARTRRPDARAPAPRGARRRDRRDGDAVRARPSPTRSRSTSLPSPHYVQGVTQLGRPSVAHATAAGKVMLAFTARVPPAAAAGLHARARSPIPAALEAELERVRGAAGPRPTRSASRS